jgi:hypothetical protein
MTSRSAPLALQHFLCLQPTPRGSLLCVTWSRSATTNRCAPLALHLLSSAFSACWPHPLQAIALCAPWSKVPVLARQLCAHSWQQGVHLAGGCQSRVQLVCMWRKPRRSAGPASQPWPAPQAGCFMGGIWRQWFAPIKLHCVIECLTAASHSCMRAVCLGCAVPQSSRAAGVVGRIGRCLWLCGRPSPVCRAGLQEAGADCGAVAFSSCPRPVWIGSPVWATLIWAMLPCRTCTNARSCRRPPRRAMRPRQGRARRRTGRRRRGRPPPQVWAVPARLGCSGGSALGRGRACCVGVGAPRCARRVAALGRGRGGGGQQPALLYAPWPSRAQRRPGRHKACAVCGPLPQDGNGRSSSLLFVSE